MQDLKIIEVHGSELTTTSLIIAEKCNVQHKNLLTLINKYINDLHDVGRVAFETRTFETKGGKQSQEIVILDDYAAMLVLTHMRSNGVVKKFKKELINEFKRLRSIINEPNRQQAIQSKRDAHKPMQDMLKFVRETDNKDTLKHHHFNENLFCNRALTGEWKSIEEDNLDTYDLRLLDAIRNHNTLLITRYPVQKDRKKIMDKFVSDYKEKHPRFLLVK